MKNTYSYALSRLLVGGEFEMLEKLLLAATLTFSLNLFLGLGRPTDAPTNVGAELQEIPTQTVSQLPK